MAIVVTVCLLALASALFPIVEIIITVVVGLATLIAVGHGVAYFRRQRKLDWEAMYGPLDEKETVNDKH